MTLSDLFDQLLTDRSVTVELDKQTAESLRVQLSKKWSKYKVEMDACGFLSDDLAACSLMRRRGETEGSYEFVLAPKQRSAVSYTILAPLPRKENQDATV